VPTIEDGAEYFIKYGTVVREMLQAGDEGIGARRFCPGTSLAQNFPGNFYFANLYTT
jgi:hypothetical protein